MEDARESGSMDAAPSAGTALALMLLSAAPFPFRVDAASASRPPDTIALRREEADANPTLSSKWLAASARVAASAITASFTTTTSYAAFTARASFAAGAALATTYAAIALTASAAPTLCSRRLSTCGERHVLGSWRRSHPYRLRMQHRPCRPRLLVHRLQLLQQLPLLPTKLRMGRSMEW